MPTYRILTLGCKLNQADSGILEARLRSLGLTRAEETMPSGSDPCAAGPTADVVLLNTCTVTGNADREARQIARRLRRAHPGALLIATGCYAQRDPSGLRAAGGVDHVVGVREQAERVPVLVAEALGLASAAGERGAPVPPAVAANDLGPFGATDSCDPNAGLAGRTRAFLKIQDGCDLRCSYCVIPSVRGGSRSLPPELVLRQIARLIDAGHREVVFTGVNTGDYGRDLVPPGSLGALLRRAVGVPGLGRLRLNSLEPRTITAEVAGLLADGGGRLAPHLQVPLQSGCDAVLARMRRNYRTADYARAVEGLRAAVPGIGLGADVIVGFPGETDPEFEATHRFIASSPLNYLHVFSYSARPGTAAAALPPVAPEAIRERSARLRALGRELSLRFRRSLVGRALQVLTLGEVLPDGRLRALSDNFVDLGIDLAGREALPLMNRLLTARVVAAEEGGTLATLAGS
jgi:threonylcarbamoyladenosine tRNA methylthiotransferase MtaB